MTGWESISWERDRQLNSFLVWIDADYDTRVAGVMGGMASSESSHQSLGCGRACSIALVPLR